MTIDQIIQSNFSHLSAMPEQVKQEQIEALLYIQKMAGITGTDISQWDIFKVFYHGWDNQLICTNKGMINKKMMEWEAQEKREIPVEIRVLDQSIQDNIKNDIQRFFTAQKDNLAAEIGSLHGEANRRLEEYEERMTRAWKSKQLLRAMEKHEPVNLLDGFNRVMSSGFWQYDTYLSNSISMVTKQGVVLEQKNDAAGIDLRIPMGKYRASMDLKRMQLRLMPHEHNVTTRNGYYHPYVSTEGKICWGNMSYEADELLKKGQIAALFELLQALITNYSEDTTPYESLEEFQREYNKTAPQTLQKDIVALCSNCEYPEGDCRCCGTCENHEDNCECYYCEICDERLTEPCEDHYCSVCDEYSRHRECCCRACENSQDNCTCCGVCGGCDYESCDCCSECDRPGSTIRRDGHGNGCSHRTEQEEVENENNTD